MLRKVLIIEDDPVLRSSIEQTLKLEDHSHKRVYTGASIDPFELSWCDLVRH